MTATDPPRRRRKAPASRRPAAAKRDIPFPVVGVGASAGGLEAFRTLLRALPAKSGMAFILIQHLDPTHASMMVELLSSHAAMPVVEGADGAQLEPDHIYVIPPGRLLAVREGLLRLTEPPSRPAVRMPFDFLLQSMADELGERAVCVILSGTANDGSVGSMAIKAAGGLVIAQSPEEAEFDGMPRSAIAAGAVDLVLPLASIPQALARYGGHRYLQTPDWGEAPPPGGSHEQIIELLRRRTSHDFALYKPGTLGRRIERRMALNGIEESARYLELLTRDAAELQHLADDLLINVTRFFRDPKAFGLLAEKVLPDLVRRHDSDRPIRVWVAGCSTGEEAYSIAILLLEEIAKTGRNTRLQIFATDVDADALAAAREGLYSLSIEADVAAPRLERFFSREDRGYRVSRELRAAIVFSVHDLLTDAPFSRLDMVSCRNLLIYLRPEVQQKVVSLFNFALAEGGVLFLGGSETVGEGADRFEPIFKMERIFRHIGRPRPGDVELPLGRGAATRSLWIGPERAAGTPVVAVGDLAQRLLLERYAPASVLVGRRHQGLYYFGPTDLYLKMPTGEASLDVLASARDGLRPAIRAAIDKAAQGRAEITVAGRLTRDGGSVAVSVTARPVTRAGEDLVLLSFSDLPGSAADLAPRPLTPAETSRVSRLEEELETTRRELSDAIRDREIAEEEIRAINEEAMSVNEEFQTTNEELETSHEELQSLNEELTALNSQLQETLSQQRSMSDDLQNILNSSDLATLFLDEDLKIRYYTPAAKALFSVIATDVGRPLADLARHFANPDLLSDARAVLSNLVPIAREIAGENAAWYNCRTLPYRTKDNRIGGVVITFTDITARKRAEDMANAARLLAQNANLGKSRFLAAASHDLRQPLQTLSLLLGLLKKKVADVDGRLLLARSEEALMAMSGMLNSLLDINQLEAGVIHPEVADFPVQNLLDTLSTEFAYHAEAKRLGWRVVPCRHNVRTDPRLLEQVLRNLLSNAVKYTQKGRLLLGCRRRSDKLLIEVWDTGLGMPEDQLNAIFEEFHQLENPARELSRGLGLGLAIVQRLADLLGLAVHVHSREGRGSVFSVEAPLGSAGLPLFPEDVEAADDDAAARSGSVLIVEDDPALRESLELFLRADGHVTTSASDGVEAIALIETGRFRPDIVMVDYNLPRQMTGLQLMTRLSGSLPPGTPAIILTGDISTETLRRIAAHGFDHRTKPASAEDLSRQIRRILAKRAPPPHSRPSTAPRVGPDPVIFVIDDDHAIRETLCELLAASGRAVEAFASAEAFLAAHPQNGNGIVLLDALMPGMSGLALLDRLRADDVHMPVILITGNGDVRMAVSALRAGAVDFIEKPVSETELFASIDRALELARDAAKNSLSRSEAKTRLAGLTARQQIILDKVLAGNPSKVIAADLSISQRTVEAHRAAIMRRTGAQSISELVRLALAAT